MSKLPEWVSTDEQNEKFGEASAFGAPDTVLSTEKATDGFIRIKKSMMQSAANQGFHFSLLYYSYSYLFPLSLSSFTVLYLYIFCIIFEVLSSQCILILYSTIIAVYSILSMYFIFSSWPTYSCAYLSTTYLRHNCSR